MSNEPNIVEIRRQLAELGVDESRIQGIDVGADGKVTVVVVRGSGVYGPGVKAIDLMAAKEILGKSYKPPAVWPLSATGAALVRAIGMPTEKLDRYRPCECGSGAKFKFCCGRRVA